MMGHEVLLFKEVLLEVPVEEPAAAAAGSL